MKRLFIAVVLISGCVRPVPGPAPPPAPPVPIVEPIVTAPLRVLVVKNNGALNQLPSAQLAALLSGTVRDYCKSHCRLGADGKTPDYRTYEWTADLSLESPEFRDLFNEAVTQGKASGVPWLVVNNGTKGFSGPYPATEADVMSTLKKYGGE